MGAEATAGLHYKLPELAVAQAGLLLGGCGFTRALGKEVAASANKPKPVGFYSVGPGSTSAHTAVQARLLELEAAAIAPFVLPLHQQGASLRQVTRTLNYFGLRTRRAPSGTCRGWGRLVIF